MPGVFDQMQAISLDRSGFAQTALASLATIAALALLGVVLALWTWAWLGPKPEARAPAAAQSSGRLEAALGLFGRAQRASDVAAPTGIAIRLLGSVAATGELRGYAVVQLDAKQILAVREGEDLAPGIRLAEVATDHIILERGGVRESLAMPGKTPALQSATLPTQ